MNKLSDKILGFAKNEDGQNFYEDFKDYFMHYSTEVYGAKNKVYDREFSLAAKSESIEKKFITEILAHSGVANFDAFAPEQWVTNPMIKWATFAVVNTLIDAVLPDVLIDSIGAYTDIRAIDYGDSKSFDVKSRDLFYVTKSGRGKRHQEAKRQYVGQVNVDPVEHDVTVFVSLYRVLAGKENLAEFVTKAIRSIEHQMTLDAYSTFNSAFAGVTSYVDELYVSGYSQDGAIKLAQTVQAWNGGNKPIFVGTQLAVQNILPKDPNYRYDLIGSEYVRLGYVKTAFGFDVVVLPQKANWKNEFELALDDDKIYCISTSSDKLVKMVIEGKSRSIIDGQHDNADLTQHATLKMNWGTAVCTSEVYGWIDLS